MEFVASSGWRLKRVTLNARNPRRAMPDAWKRRTLEESGRRAAMGENPAKPENGEPVEQAQGKRAFRYTKALSTQPLCVDCHGGGVATKPQ